MKPEPDSAEAHTGKTVAPFGIEWREFLSVRYRKNSKGRWGYDPIAAEVVREIYDMTLDGKTTAQIKDKLFAHRRLAPREYDYQKKGKDIIPEFNWSSW